MEIPEVLEQSSGANEEFEDYIKRWSTELNNFPQCLVEHWVYRNWPDFKDWLPMNVLSWKYEKRTFSNEEIIERIRPFTKTIENLDAWGQQLFTNPVRRKLWLGEYMLEHGTTPAPILVLENNGTIIHPESTLEDQMLLSSDSLQLIEGHMRTSYLRCMIFENYEKIKPEHELWVASI
jgi:hypothetical protein